MPLPKLRLLALAALVVALSLVPVAGAGAQTLPCVKGVTCTGTTPPPTATGCADADLVPGLLNGGRIRSSTLCLLNRQRDKHGLRRLHSNGQLQKAAQRYARQMVRQRFFDHVVPGRHHVRRAHPQTSYLNNARRLVARREPGLGHRAASPRRARSSRRG